jgi:hypothetical protein
MCGDLSREGGIAGKNQDGGTIHVLIIALWALWLVLGSVATKE